MSGTTDPPDTPVTNSPTVAPNMPITDSPTAAPNTTSPTAVPNETSPTAPPITVPPVAAAPPTDSSEKKADQQCNSADGKCGNGCSADGTCNKESCKCDSSCKCKCKSGKPDNCQSSNPVDCSDGTCKFSKSEDPTNVGLVTNGKCLGPALYEGPEKPECKEGDKKQECQGKKECAKKAECEKKKESDKERCPLSEQKADTPGLKEILKPCAHPDNNIHKQEEHHKICSPLPQGDKLKAILFDIDGTIADSDPIHFLAFQEVLAEAGYNGGVPISHEFFIRQMSGKLNYVIAEELMPEMDEKKRIEMMDEKEARYRQLAAKDLQPIPGFLKFSEYVKKRGLRRAAVTNSPRLNAEQVIAALKIPDFFEIVVVGSECDNPKPSPDPYLKAIKFLGVEASQCFVLEDSPSGIKAGRAAGSPVVGLLTGHPGPVLRDNGASVLIQDYHDSALWIALGEEHSAYAGSQSQDSTPSTGVPPPTPVPA
ncbi:hypothetical protein KC19_4G180100 [Ceratodon purpureus]|uniref:Uncharacterized protein n=1 Tax=Ceratodon purpureus TaxID=3225 RepID=A0A8T0ICG7_CERPU|nr:hypothetical protein KC19_4G180100 [Ceratodon purpureus]